MESRSPWEVLGIAENSSDEVAKTAWRKLVMKCHPDKAQPEMRDQMTEEFKAVNKAYKEITDPEERKKLNDAAEAKKRFREHGSSSYPPATPARSYNTRTAAPSSTRDRDTAWDYGRSRSDDRYYEDDTRSASRKYDGYDSYTKKSPRTPRSDREGAKVSKESEKSTRSERRRTRDREEKHDRETKYSFVESEDDERDRDRYEKEYRKRSDEDRERERYAEESRRYEEVRREDRKDSRSRSDRYKHESQADEARDYMKRSMHSSTSSRRPQSSKDDTVRRSSARRVDRDRRRGSSQEIVDPPLERRLPRFETSSSSPAGLKIPRTPIERSRSDFDREDIPSPPAFRRSETAPSSRRKDSVPVNSSKLRTALGPDDSGYSSPVSPSDIPIASPSQPPFSPAASHKYVYSPSSRSVNLMDESYERSNGYRTVRVEPETSSRRHRSPGTPRFIPTVSPSSHRPVYHESFTQEPLSASSSDEAGPSPASRRPSASHYSTIRRTPSGHSPSTSSVPFPSGTPGRGSSERANRLFGEIPSERADSYFRSPPSTASPSVARGGRSGASFDMGNVQSSRRFTPEDVNRSSPYTMRSGRERSGRPMADYNNGRPGMARSQTIL